MIEELLAEVQGLADDRMDELLPLLLAQLVEREGLHPCRRHNDLLVPYIRAQIWLTRAKRNYYRWDGCYTSRPLERPQTPETVMVAAETTRDAARRIYRAEPCTCWVPHR